MTRETPKKAIPLITLDDPPVAGILRQKPHSCLSPVRRNANPLRQCQGKRLPVYTAMPRPSASTAFDTAWPHPVSSARRRASLVHRCGREEELTEAMVLSGLKHAEAHELHHALEGRQMSTADARSGALN